MQRSLLTQLYKSGTHQHLEFCVWLCHIKNDPTQLEQGQEKETRMIKSRRWLMGCEQLSWLALQPKERWLGLRREIEMCPMDWSLWRLTVQCFLWGGKRNKVIKNTSEQTSNLFTPRVDELCRASTTGCSGCSELGFKTSSWLLSQQTQRLTKYRDNSCFQVKCKYCWILRKHHRENRENVVSCVSCPQA